MAKAIFSSRARFWLNASAAYDLEWHRTGCSAASSLSCVFPLGS